MGQEMGFQGAQRFWPPRSGMPSPQHLWGVRVEGTVVIDHLVAYMQEEEYQLRGRK